MPTLKDIARECGVTTATVSMAINDKGRIAPATRNRIMETVQRMGYHPNNGPAALPPRLKTRTIGLVMPGVHSWTGGFYHRAVTAATEIAPTFGHDCKIIPSEELYHRVVENYHKGPEQLGCDHVIYFCPIMEWTVTAPALRNWGMRIAVIRRPVAMHGVIGITDDDYAGFRLAVEHLADLGHRTVIMLKSSENPGLTDRVRAYRDVVRERGLTDDERLIVPMIEERSDIQADVAQLRGAGLDVTAVMASGDHLAVIAAQWLLRAGYRIPDDISIMGYDDDPICRGFYPNISSVKVPVEEMMTAAFRALIDPAPELAGAQQTITFGNELVIRESTGKARKN